ncbi:glycoside hydrolase family 19 protein [Mycobacterium kansasii]
MNGGLECGHGRDDRVEDRIGFYKRYCDILKVGYGNALNCNNQRPFGSTTSTIFNGLGLGLGLAS